MVTITSTQDRPIFKLDAATLLDRYPPAGLTYRVSGFVLGHFAGVTVVRKSAEMRAYGVDRSTP